jgi:hypothetical protein
MAAIYQDINQRGIESKAVPTGGAAIDSLRLSYSDLVSNINKHIQVLRAAGCIHAHIHFKADGKTMFMNAPSDSTGQRKYIHVGVNPIKQHEARNCVYREGLRNRLSVGLHEAAQKMHDLEYKLKMLEIEYNRSIVELKVLQQICSEPIELTQEG